MTRHLIVDPTKCDGVGICAIKAPRLIQLDYWGFPMVDDAALTPKLEREAQRAIDACPKRALLLVDRETGPQFDSPAAP